MRVSDCGRELPKAATNFDVKISAPKVWQKREKRKKKESQHSLILLFNPLLVKKAVFKMKKKSFEQFQLTAAQTK